MSATDRISSRVRGPEARISRGRLWGVAGSIAAHVVLLAIALWSLRTPGPPPEPNTVQVQLVRPSLPLARPKPPRAVLEPGRRASVPLIPPPRSQAPEGAAAPPPIAVPSEEEEATGAVRSTLRAALGCEHAALLGLSAEERQRCQEKMAGHGEAARLAFNLDPHGHYARDPNPEPYLVRKPKNGCKPMAHADQTPNGTAAFVGVACGKQF